MEENTGAKCWVKHDTCNECIWFCSKSEYQGGRLVKEKNWCSKTKAAVHPYAKACEKFCRSLAAGPWWADKRQIATYYAIGEEGQG